jgi:hypothetical protein
MRITKKIMKMNYEVKEYGKNNWNRFRDNKF